MPETIKRVKYFYATVKDKPGEGRRLLEFCSAHGVNLVNFTAFPVGKGEAQLDFFPQDSQKLKLAAKEAGITLVGPKKAFLIQKKFASPSAISIHPAAIRFTTAISWV